MVSVEFKTMVKLQGVLTSKNNSPAFLMDFEDCQEKN
jgi:hypothetical protein